MDLCLEEDLSMTWQWGYTVRERVQDLLNSNRDDGDKTC